MNLLLFPPNTQQTPVEIQTSMTLQASAFVSVCYLPVGFESNLLFSMGLVVSLATWQI